MHSLFEMDQFVLFCILTLFVNSVASNSRDKKLNDILDGVRKIEELLNKEERLREITDIVRIDSTIDRMSTKLDRVIGFLEHGDRIMPISRSSGPSSSSSMVSSDLSRNLEGIDSRLLNLENTVVKLEKSLLKADISFQKMEEIDMRTLQLKEDVNKKLSKLMNVITAVYEMNKDIKVNFGSRSQADDTKEISGSNYATEFFIENLEELERKIKEQFSVLGSEIRSEITSLKIVASSMSDNCNPPSYDEDDEWLTARNNARSAPSQRKVNVEVTLDNLVESLGRSTREIREEIHQGIQGIDVKLTEIAQNQPQCEMMVASQSITNSRRSIQAFDRPSEQKIDEFKDQKNQETCTKIAHNISSPKSCADLRKGGATCDGIYVIFPKGLRAVRVFCDMTTNGGGWTVIMRRGDFGDKMISFHKNWLSYKNGFGDSEGEFWLGNDVINLMTTEEENQLRIHLSAFDGNEIDLDYSSFSVDDESSNYQLHIGAPLRPNNAANSLRYHNNSPFSTFDRKNDKSSQNCAATYKGGWWFNGCYFGFLTGEYFRQEDKREHWQGILWYDWKGNSSLKAAQMMIRPKNIDSL